MPVVIPERVIGEDGAALLEIYTDPRFLFTALIELENTFVNMIKRKFQDFYGDGEVTATPPVLPSHNPGDRKFYAIIVEAQINQLGSQGLGKNKFEVQYQPNPDDVNTVETYIGFSGDVTYTIEVYVRANSKFAVAYLTDWVVASLQDPVCQTLSGYGIQIPYNSVRFLGKIQELVGPDGLDKFFNMTLTIPGIMLPWARLYRLEGPVIESFRTDPTTDGITMAS